MIKIIAIGKKTDYDIKINEYVKRLNKNFKIEWVLLNYSLNKNNESKEIFDKIKEKDFVILLDERGKEINNDLLCDKITKNQNVVFVIGGPYGVNDEIRKRSNFILKLSELIFPYEICRLMLIEQIYRSQEIFLNHPYHHK